MSKELKRALKAMFIYNNMFVMMILCSVLLLYIVSSKEPCAGQEWNKIISLNIIWFGITFLFIEWVKSSRKLETDSIEVKDG